uniref:Uncharacterized protein n=1 Tax=Rhipicephalus appendiculatus TaxID=34631 RepID=A0A131YK06_RHIAP
MRAHSKCTEPKILFPKNAPSARKKYLKVEARACCSRSPQHFWISRPNPMRTVNVASKILCVGSNRQYCELHTCPPDAVLQTEKMQKNGKHGPNRKCLPSSTRPRPPATARRNLKTVSHTDKGLRNVSAKDRPPTSSAKKEKNS